MPRILRAISVFGGCLDRYTAPRNPRPSPAVEYRVIHSTDPFEGCVLSRLATACSAVFSDRERAAPWIMELLLRNFVLPEYAGLFADHLRINAMDCRLVNTQRPEQAKPKRIQRFIRFVLKPGDEELIGQLSTNQQAILAVKGSYEERGMRLGIPPGTVRSRLHRARSALVRLREGRTDGR